MFVRSWVFICKMRTIIIIALYPNPRVCPSLGHIKDSINFICYNYEFSCLQIPVLEDIQLRLGGKEGLLNHHSLKDGCSFGAENEGIHFNLL